MFEVLSHVQPLTIDNGESSTRIFLENRFEICTP